MKPADVNSSNNIDFDKKNSQDNSKFKDGGHVKISEYKNIFAKAYVLNWSEELFIIKNVNNTVTWTYVISDLNGKKLL